jgi:hypothetical protein
MYKKKLSEKIDFPNSNIFFELYQSCLNDVAVYVHVTHLYPPLRIQKKP